MVFKRKSYNAGDTNLKKKYRTKRRVKDLDQIDEDLQPKNAKQLLNQEVDFDKPGNAQFYCIHCARYFINNQALQEHFGTKVHKRRLKALELEPYTTEDAERAAGHGSWKQPAKRKIETQPPVEDSSPKKLVSLRSISRRFSSSLYITGDKAQQNFAVLTPVVDYDNQDKQKIAENIHLRQLPINLNKVEERWQFFKEIEAKKNQLEHTRTEIGQTLAGLLKLKSDEAAQEIERLKQHLKIVKEEYKNLRSMSYSVEEGAVLQVLDLPNVVHPKTPHHAEVEIFRFLESPLGVATDSHMAIGEAKQLFKYINPMSCYLKNDAALFELALQNYFCTQLVRLNYVQFSNSDFVKSIVVEACAGIDSKVVLTFEDIHCIKSDALNKLHLVGGATLYSFMAYFTKHFVQKSQLPLKAFSCGRQYQVVDNTTERNLFNLNQSSQVGIFIGTAEEPTDFETVLNDVTEMYKQLGYHFRVLLIPANKLGKAESLRLSVQMFSNYLKQYVEVGHVSLYEDYISKRLLFNYAENKERKYVKVIGGSLVNVHKVLGCVLENNSVENKPLIGDFLLGHVTG